MVELRIITDIDAIKLKHSQKSEKENNLEAGKQEGRMTLSLRSQLTVENTIYITLRTG